MRDVCCRRSVNEGFVFAWGVLIRAVLQGSLTRAVCCRRSVNEGYVEGEC